MEKLKNKILHPNRRSRQPAEMTPTPTSTPSSPVGKPVTGFQSWAVAL
jgi:hypothetical protein